MGIPSGRFSVLAGLGYPDPSYRLRFPPALVLGVNRFSQGQAFRRGEGFHSIYPCRFLALVVLRHPPHCQQSG